MAKKIQPIKNKSINTTKTTEKSKKVVKNTIKVNKNKPKYGISKLEAYFAKEYLDKMGLKYIYEYEAKDIGRFYDFAITLYQEIPFIMENKHGIECIKQEGQNIPICMLIEIDGDYYHSNPEIMKNKKLNNMQKHNKFVDFLKDKWCEKKGIPLVRIWENDIRHNPKKVFELLNQYLGEGYRKKRIDDSKKRPH
jgi:hypothetical protein